MVLGDRIMNLAFSPDGARIASANFDRTVRVSDASTGEELLALREHSQGVNAVAFSPDGTRIASASIDNVAKTWDAATGHEMLTLEGTSKVAYGFDGRRLIRLRSGVPAVWDAGDDFLRSRQDSQAAVQP